VAPGQQEIKARASPAPLLKQRQGRQARHLGRVGLRFLRWLHFNDVAECRQSRLVSIDTLGQHLIEQLAGAAARGPAA